MDSEMANEATTLVKSVATDVTSNFMDKLGRSVTNAPANMANGAADQLGLASNALRAGIIKEPAGSNSVINFKVTLTDGLGQKVLFDVSPVLEESRQTNWDSYQITHLPANLLAFRQTNSRTFSLNAKLVSRDSLEAARNYERIQLIRQWSVPNHGFMGDGSPPNVLKLDGYTNHFKRIQVVMTSQSWSWPEDVDWIHTGFEPFPVVMNVSLSLQEVFSPEQLTYFDKYRINGPRGGVAGWEKATADMTNSERDYLSVVAMVKDGKTIVQATDELTKIKSAASVVRAKPVVPVVDTKDPLKAMVESVQSISSTNLGGLTSATKAADLVGLGQLTKTVTKRFA